MTAYVDFVNSGQQFCFFQNLLIWMGIRTVKSVWVNLVSNYGSDKLYFHSENIWPHKGTIFSIFFAKLTLKTIGINIMTYISLKLYNAFQSRCWYGCNICGFFKGKKTWNNPSIDSNEYKTNYNAILDRNYWSSCRVKLLENGVPLLVFMKTTM